MKKLFLGAMAFLVAVTLVACGSKKDADESIKENKKLVVAVSPDYPPFEFKTLVDGKDQVVGSDIKLAQAIANELGVKLEVGIEEQFSLFTVRRCRACIRGTAKVHSRERTGFKRLLREPPLVDLVRIVGKVEVMKLNRL